MRACVKALLIGIAISVLLTPAKAETKLTIMVFQGLQNLPFFAAENKGFFAKRDLEMDIKIAPNSDEMRNGLAEGRYQIVHGAIDNAVAMAEVAKADIAVVCGGDNGWNQLIVQPDIGSVAELRGKTVIVDSPNTAYALQLYALLAQRPEKGDYEVKWSGRHSASAEAIRKTRRSPPRCSTRRSRSRREGRAKIWARP